MEPLITKEQLEKCIKSGMDFREISIKYQCSVSTVKKYKREYGLASPRSMNHCRNHRLHKVEYRSDIRDIGKLRALAEAGWSIKKLMMEFGCPAEYILDVCRQNDIKVRYASY